MEEFSDGGSTPPASTRKKNHTVKVSPDKKTSWGKRERYSFGYAVFLILALMK